MRLITILLIFTMIAGCNKSEEKTVVKEEKQIEKTVKNSQDTNIIQISNDAGKLADVRTFIVKNKLFHNEVLTTGVIKENKNNVFEINSGVSGRIIKDNVSLGDYIKKGQILAVVQNQEVIKIYSGYIYESHLNEINIRQAKIKLDLARSNMDREEKLLKEGISSKKEYIQASSDYTLAKSEVQGLEQLKINLRKEAEALLSSYGVALGKGNSENIESKSPVIATKSGVITKKNITAGHVVNPEQVMYEVSDLGEVWLEVNVYDKDMANVRLGQEITFKTDSVANHDFYGKISYLQPFKNEENKTFIARAVLNNSSGLLKPGMFGDVSVAGLTSVEKPFLTKDAVQTYGKETFVFQEIGTGKYTKVPVELAEPLKEGFLVNKGIKTGMKVVGKGSFTLKAEMLKSEFKEE